MSGSVRPLKIVKFNAEDYTIGKVIVRADASRVASSDEIDAALSLYFQWPERRVAMAMMPTQTDDRDKFVYCELDYDRDERAPTEIQVRLETTDRFDTDLRPDDKLNLRFEVFRACYEMKCVVLARSEDPASDGWHYIVSAPEEMHFYRNRRLPRVDLDDAARATLGETTWMAADGSTTPLRVLDMGMSALRVDGTRLEPGMSGRLVVGGQSFDASVARVNRGEAIVRPCFENGMDTGRYFDIYRRFAFPHLQPKFDYAFVDLVDLYNDTNYFGKFTTPEEQSQRVHAITDVWNAVKPGQHGATADYVITDDAGSLIGASSLTECFRVGDTPYWAFHQLCARKRPDMLERTEELYAWRAEYLAARPGNHKAIVWFDSRSRWLERIYVKFALHSESAAKLRPVSVYRAPCRPAEPIATSEIAIGETRRHVAHSDDLIGGMGPRYLNAAGCLEAVIALGDGMTSDRARAFGEGLAAAAGATGELTELTLPPGTVAELGDMTFVDDVDRYIEIDKDGLVDFMHSVEHSVAVTRRKNEKVSCAA